MKLSHGKVYAAFAVAVALAMGLSLRNGFVYDDIEAIVRNTRITDPSFWHTIPGAPYWLGTLWRPFTVAMDAAQWFVGRGSAWVFHLTSLLAYLAVGILLYRFMERLGVVGVTAAATITIFLLHPVHVEAVANGVGQAELWVALALLLATMTYVRARQDGNERRALPALLALVAIGIMSKEQGFVVPLLLAGAEWLLLADRSDTLGARMRLLVPVTALTTLLFIVRGVLLNDNVGETPAVALRGLNPDGRLVTFFAVVPEWARLIVWPWHLQADYGPPGIPVGGPMTARHWLGALLVAAFVALFFWSRRRAPVAAFGLFWAAVTLAPVSNLLRATGIVMAERVLFLPTIGIAFAVAGWAMYWNAGRVAGSRLAVRAVWPFLVATFVIYAIALTIRSATRVPTWSTQERFFTDITRDGTNAYRGWKVSAEYWDGVGDESRAITELTHSIALWPRDAEDFEALGQIYRRQGHCDHATLIFWSGLLMDSSASPLRAKLVECLLALRRWNEAADVANAGVALGQDEFKAAQAQVAKMRRDTTRRAP